VKFRNKKKSRYGIPAYNGPFQALVMNITIWMGPDGR
jgi:hypothetical protein